MQPTGIIVISVLIILLIGSGSLLLRRAAPRRIDEPGAGASPADPTAGFRDPYR